MNKKILSAVYLGSVSEKINGIYSSYLKFGLTVQNLDTVYDIMTIDNGTSVVDGRAYGKSSKILGLKKNCNCTITGSLLFTSSVGCSYYRLDNNTIKPLL